MQGKVPGWVHKFHTCHIGLGTSKMIVIIQLLISGAEGNDVDSRLLT